MCTEMLSTDVPHRAAELHLCYLAQALHSLSRVPLCVSRDAVASPPRSRATHVQEGAATLERLHGASSDFTELLLVWDNKRKGTLQGPIDEKLLLTISRLAELASKCADPRIVHGIDGLVRARHRATM